jgi:uncharacterized membrane protein YjjP (DUF1212 family)
MKSLLLATLIAAVIGSVFALISGRWDLALPATIVGLVVATVATLIPSSDGDADEGRDRAAR